MVKIFIGTLLLAMVLVVPIPTIANGNIGIRVSLPPVEFSAPPEVIVIPGTYVYVVPDADVDIFFYAGWWWRPWEGRWYRSRTYSSGWRYYQNVPSFYLEIPSGWRNDYREHRWQGHPWNYQRIPHQQFRSNWSNWEKNRYWEQQNTWGVQGYQSQPQSREIQRPSAVQPPAEPQSSGEFNNEGDGQQYEKSRGDSGDKGNKPGKRGNKGHGRGNNR